MEDDEALMLPRATAITSLRHTIGARIVIQSTGPTAEDKQRVFR